MNIYEIIADHLTHLLTQHGYQPNTTHRVNHTRIALCPGNHDHTNPFERYPPTLPVCPHNCPHIHVIHIGQPEHTTIRLVTGSREYGWKAITTHNLTHPESLDQFEQELLTHLKNDKAYKGTWDT